MTLSRRDFIATLGALTATTVLASARRAQAEAVASTVVVRTTILYVIIDRPEDADLGWHWHNEQGVKHAASLLDPALTVKSITIAELLDMDERAIDERWHPLAIVGAGSFSEWFHYARDRGWRRQLDHWMDLIRTMKIPMLAICGTHQLVAAAFNGWGAVAHMNDEGPPVRISDELAMSDPRGTWTNPRVGEEGAYPLVATGAGALDPVVAGTAGGPFVSTHHKDMVIDATGFVVLYQPDESRPPMTTRGEQAQKRCRVQAMRLASDERLLYTTQFHPEIRVFDESTKEDVGFGNFFIASFLGRARCWWQERPGIALVGA